MTEEIKTQPTEEEKPTVKSAATTEVIDKLEDAVTDLFDEAKDDKHPWYAKVSLYIVATILGIITYLIANFGYTIYIILDKWFNSLIK